MLLKFAALARVVLPGSNNSPLPLNPLLLTRDTLLSERFIPSFDPEEDEIVLPKETEWLVL